MMLLPWTAIQIDDGGGLDAADLGPDYTYTLTTNSSGAITAVKKGGTAATPIKTSTTTSWGFDSEGYGPFNSFYAAFSTTTGELVTVLNPNDLAHSIDSLDTTNYQGSTAYNIMWVLPKVYWKATSTSLILTNNPGENPGANGWCCLGHTIDGKEYNYLAIGVYEAYVDSLDSSGKITSSSKMYSISDVKPTASNTRVDFRAAAERTTVEDGYAMQWNFFQWTLYKMCTYTVVGSKNVQKEYAYGLVKGSTANTGTETNNSPYYSKGAQTAANSGTAGPSKVFIENSWGNVWEFVDNVIFSGKAIKAGYSHNATDTVSSLNVITASYSLPSSNWITATQYANEVWDLPKSSSSTSGATGNYGDAVTSYTGNNALYVGGFYSGLSDAGVACVNAMNSTSSLSSHTGSRLAYVFDNGPLSINTVTFDPNGGTLAVTEEKVKFRQSITLPSATREGHTFQGWYTESGTFIGNAGATYTPTSNITLVAHWLEIPITITFRGQENHLIATLSIPKNTTPVVFTPNFEDAIFTGWFYDQSCTQPYNPTTPLSQDTTLWADAQEYLRFTSNPVSDGRILTMYNSNMFVFDATPSESAMTIEWDFGDGTTSTDRIAYHTYAEKGTYQVSLTSTNYYGQQDTVVYTITYGAEPTDTIGYGTFFALGLAVALIAVIVARRIF